MYTRCLLLINGSATTHMAQENDLREVASALHTEYTLRRRMLLERLKVTLQVCTRHGLEAG